VKCRFPSAGQRKFSEIRESGVWIAIKLELSGGQVSRIRNGQSRPSHKVMFRIARVYSIPVERWEDDLTCDAIHTTNGGLR
jgi:transcriptional regulator with XRE-family HTH domain